MRITLQYTIEKFDEGSNKEILNQSFSNEHIVKKNLISVNIIKTEFTNCKFNNIEVTSFGNLTGLITLNHAEKSVLYTGWIIKTCK
jgi:hypothetical protein